MPGLLATQIASLQPLSRMAPTLLCGSRKSGGFLQLPTSTRVWPLAQQRQLVARLAQALAAANDREQVALAGLLERAVALGRELEEAMLCLETDSSDAQASRDQILDELLDVSLELGKILGRAREIA